MMITEIQSWLQYRAKIPGKLKIGLLAINLPGKASQSSTEHRKLQKTIFIIYLKKKIKKKHNKPDKLITRTDESISLQATI